MAGQNFAPCHFKTKTTVMKKIILVLAVMAFIYNVNASDNNGKKGTEVAFEKEGNFVQPKHPKHKDFNGKLVTRADYVKSSNPKRLHWNKINERNNPVKWNIVNSCPKRKNLMRVLSKERTDVSSPKSTFVRRKRNHS